MGRGTWRKVLCEWTCAQFSYGTSIKTGGVCFNKSYCIAFLEREFRRNSIEIPFGKVIDSLILARKRVRDINDYTLESLAGYFGISCVQHRARPDCEILYKVFLELNEI